MIMAIAASLFDFRNYFMAPRDVNGANHNNNRINPLMMSIYYLIRIHQLSYEKKRKN